MQPVFKRLLTYSDAVLVLQADSSPALPTQLYNRQGMDGRARRHAHPPTPLGPTSSHPTARPSPRAAVAAGTAMAPAPSLL
jgi:hypothetical protein